MTKSEREKQARELALAALDADDRVRRFVRLDPGEPFVFEETMTAGVHRARRSTIIDQWHDRKVIDSRQKQAASVFWLDFQAANLLDRYAVQGLDRVDGGGNIEGIAARQADAKKRIGQAMGAMGQVNGSAVWNVVGLEMSIMDHVRRLRWAGMNMDRRTARKRVIDGLALLSNHYRI